MTTAGTEDISAHVYVIVYMCHKHILYTDIVGFMDTCHLHMCCMQQKVLHVGVYFLLISHSDLTRHV